MKKRKRQFHRGYRSQELVALWREGVRTAKGLADKMDLSERQVHRLFNDPTFQYYLQDKCDEELPAKLERSEKLGPAKNRLLYYKLRHYYHYLISMNTPENQTAKQLLEHDECNVSPRTIYNWIKDYKAGVDRFVKERK